MRLCTLSLRDFRNIAAARIVLEGSRHFFLGPNGQGKTNLLEAAGCLTALRSFRTAETAALIRAGASEAGIAADIDHEHRGATALRILWRIDGKELWSDGEKVKRLSDHLGHFPVVAFSSQDLQLVRGAPALRRRWLDLTLAAMDAAYLRALQTYTRALADRNKLLKTPAPDLGAIAAFEQVLAPAAAILVRLRLSGLAELGATLAAHYHTLSGAAEPASLEYSPSVANPPAQAGQAPPAWKGQVIPSEKAASPAGALRGQVIPSETAALERQGGLGAASLPGGAGPPDPPAPPSALNAPSSPSGVEPPLPSGQETSGQSPLPSPIGATDPGYWLQAFAQARPSDLRLKSTSIGPHRDDLMMLIGGSPARDYGSEGQQRSFVLALRLAQAAWFMARSRTLPVILADDVLGELDPDRRRRFWSALDPRAQVLATGTSLPDPELGAWQTFSVSAGQFLRQ